MMMMTKHFSPSAECGWCCQDTASQGSNPFSPTAFSNKSSHASMTATMALTSDEHNQRTDACTETTTVRAAVIIYMTTQHIHRLTQQAYACYGTNRHNALLLFLTSIDQASSHMHIINKLNLAVL